MVKIIHIFRFIVHNVAAAFIVFCIAIIVAPPLMIIAALPQRLRFENKIYYFFADFFYKGIMWATFLPVYIEGKENLINEPSIIIANHQSSLDIPLLGSLLDQHPHVWLFLARFSRIPIFGFIVRRMNVVVDHSGLRKLVGALDKTMDIVKTHNSHILLFPEGGRYVDGTIHKFFYGFAILAQSTKRPIIPIIIDGAGYALPPRTFFLRYSPIKIIIGRPVYFSADHSQEEIVRSMEEWFKRTYKQ